MAVFKEKPLFKPSVREIMYICSPKEENDMEKISVTDFGPIRHTEIEIKQFCILIGHTSSGKSTVAKLLDLFNSLDFYAIEPGYDLKIFFYLKKYGIDYKFNDQTCIVYQKDEYTWTITLKGIQTNFPYYKIIQDFRSTHILKFSKNPKEFILPVINCLDEEIRSAELQELEQLEQMTEEYENSSYLFRFYRQLIDKYICKGNNSIYIPAERILMSVLSQSIFSFYEKGINIPECLKVFGNLFFLSKGYESYTIDFLNLKILFDIDTDNGDKIQLKDGEIIEFSHASSGLQSVIPLLSVFDFNLKENTITIIEEPELNLYTEIQKELTEYLVRRTKEAKSRLFITTHSPYILSAIQNLLQAGNVASESKVKAEQVATLVSPGKWIDFNDLTCMFFSNDGTSHNILDDEYHTIGINQMDDVSAELSEIYDSLLDIKYNE